MSKDHVRITLRIPPTLHEKLSQSADEGTRSLNNEIIKRLGASYSDDIQQQSAEDFIRQIVIDEVAKQQKPD